MPKVSGINVLGKKDMAARKTTPKKQQPLRNRDWALDQISKKHPRYHPLIAMVDIAQKKQFTKRDREAFGYHAEIARFIVPKPKMLDLSQLGEGIGQGPGEVTIKWG